MNFNIYLRKELAEEVKGMAKNLGKSRNALITEALEFWLAAQKRSQWPEGFFDFEALEDVPDFKAYRSELKPPKDDPLA